MHYLVAGLAKSGTTRLFSQLKNALDGAQAPLDTYFEPDTEERLAEILRQGRNSLTKVLIGRVSALNRALGDFDRHVLIYRDPRDQFLSMLLYLFYDFQLKGDAEGFRFAYDALALKVASPEEVSTIELYNVIAARLGRGPIAVFSRLHEVQQAYEGEFKPFMLRYEDLLTGEALSDLSAYLGLQIEAEAQVPQEYARVTRSRGFGEWKCWLNREDLEFVDREWGASARRLGYEIGGTQASLSIDTRLSLDYVKQFDPARLPSAAV